MMKWIKLGVGDTRTGDKQSYLFPSACSPFHRLINRFLVINRNTAERAPVCWHFPDGTSDEPDPTIPEEVIMKAEMYGRSRGIQEQFDPRRQRIELVLESQPQESSTYLM